MITLRKLLCHCYSGVTPSRRCETVATSVRHLAYVRTDHKAVLPPLDSTPAERVAFRMKCPVPYLVLDELWGSPYYRPSCSPRDYGYAESGHWYLPAGWWGL